MLNRWRERAIERKEMAIPIAIEKRIICCTEAAIHRAERGGMTKKAKAMINPTARNEITSVMETKTKTVVIIHEDLRPATFPYSGSKMATMIPL